ncbi:MAG: NUDIX hydrolase [Candidatus Micrarchaeales archaeon]|nr:NUDIX hydrolase [Candidatus Micrarchaeales archaeon]
MVYPDKTVHHVGVVTHRPSAVILPITKEGKIILLRQFRGPFARRIIELPAGKVDEGEEPEAAAVRELEEETGYTAESTKFLFKSLPTPGYVNEEFHCYLVRCGKNIGQKLEPSERSIIVMETSVAEALLMIRDGIIEDSKTRDAIMYYYTFLSHNRISLRKGQQGNMNGEAIEISHGQPLLK